MTVAREGLLIYAKQAEGELRMKAEREFWPSAELQAQRAAVVAEACADMPQSVWSVFQDGDSYALSRGGGEPAGYVNVEATGVDRLRFHIELWGRGGKWASGKITIGDALLRPALDFILARRRFTVKEFERCLARHRSAKWGLQGMPELPPAEGKA